MVKRVLLVDDEPSILIALTHLITRLGHKAVTAPNGQVAIDRLRAESFQLCVTDLRMPLADGLAVVKAAQAADPPVPVVVLTGHGTLHDAVAALRAGALDFLAKPFHITAFEQVVQGVLEGATTGAGRRGSPARERNGGSKTTGAALVGDHPAIRLVLERIAQIADTDAGVLIQGETGTGKEVAARLIHASSSRCSGPFVAVNMAAIPESLAESELFGHAKGAFTGAESRRLGKFQAAHKGTLFLDEIGDMPRALQAKLLRVLQEGEITPLGSSESVSVDVRVVAATNRDLEAMARDGTFREDLYYRLDVIPIKIPPLRERREDIPALADHFRRQVNTREGRSVPGFSPEVMARLCSYEWPGNVRELQNVVERLVVLAASRTVAITDLPLHLRTEMVDLQGKALDLPPEGVDLPMLLAQLEDRLIGQALERTGGNKNRAAELLGLNRTTLVEKLRRRNVA